MKIITFIYIFALYILFIPGILIKNKGLGLLSSLLYSVVLYFTLDIIDGIQRESLEQKMENQSINIRFKNIAGDSIKKQTETSEQLIHAYENLYKIRLNIEELQKQLNAYSGTNKEFEILQNVYNKVKVTYDEFKKRLDKYKNMEFQIEQLQGEVDIIEVQEKKLKNKLNACKVKESASNDSLFDKRLMAENMNKSILGVNRKKDLLNGNIIEMQGEIPQMEMNYKHMQDVCKLKEGFSSSLDVTGASSLVDLNDKMSDKVKVQYDNRISYVPINFETGDQLIKVLHSTAPSAMEELELKNKIFNYEGKDIKIDELRKKITKLNEETYQMQMILTNYGNRNIKLNKLKDRKVGSKMDITNLKHELSICKENTKSNDEYIKKEEKKISGLREKQIAGEKAYNEINENNMITLNKYKMLQNNMANFNCPV